jgi:hypothetical protein
MCSTRTARALHVICWIIWPAWPLSGTDLSKPVVVGVAEDALVAFGIAAALNGVADPAVELQKNFAEVIGENYPGKPIVHKWCGIDAPLAPLDKTVTEAITLMRSNEHSVGAVTLACAHAKVLIPASLHEM